MINRAINFQILVTVFDAKAATIKGKTVRKNGRELKICI